MFGKTILKWVLMASNIVAVVIMLLTLVGTMVSPEKFLLPAYFTLAFPFIIAINIGFVIIWIFARKWFFLLSLSILLFSAVEINNTFPVHLGKTENFQAKHPLHILTYNTMMSGKLRKHTLKKPNKVMQYVLDSNADIVCLQEFEVSDNKTYLTHEDIMRIFSKYRYKHIEYKVKKHTNNLGIATFSKYPIINKKRIEYTSYANISIYSDINVNGKIIRLVNNHLESNRLTENDKAMPIRLKDDFNADNLTGITLHFSRKLGSAYKLRAHQADAVSNIISASPYKVIACGDFNDVPSSYAYTQLKGKLKDAFSEIGTGFGWTFNDKFYHFRIDYVLYDSTAFTPVQFKVDKVNYSDHYPVLCELNIK